MKEYIKKYKNIIIASGAIVALIATIIIILNIDMITRVIKNEPIITEIKNDVINDIIIDDIESISLRDEIYNIVMSGKSGEYTIGDRNFVILTTGGKSVCKLEYDISANVDGNTVITYGNSTQSDGEYKVRYKVLEFKEPNIIIEKRKLTTVLNGASPILIFKSDESKYIYVEATGQIIEDKDLLIVDGIYIGNFIDDKLDNTYKAPSIVLKNIEVLQRSSLASNLFLVKLESGQMLEILMRDLDVIPEGKVNIIVTSDPITGLNGSLARGNTL